MINPPRKIAASVGVLLCASSNIIIADLYLISEYHTHVTHVQNARGTLGETPPPHRSLSSSVRSYGVVW